MSEWQPIDSAPKDGTWVLLIGGATDEFYLLDEKPECVSRPVSAFWMPDDFSDDEGFWAMAHWDSAWRSRYEAPTHWMPLPASPS